MFHELSPSDCISWNRSWNITFLLHVSWTFSSGLHFLNRSWNITLMLHISCTFFIVIIAYCTILLLIARFYFCFSTCELICGWKKNFALRLMHEMLIARFNCLFQDLSVKASYIFFFVKNTYLPSDTKANQNYVICLFGYLWAMSLGK